MSLKIQIMPVTPLQQNCSLIWDDETNEGVLTDVGGDVEHLLAAVDKLGVKLQAIWLTHGHVDHAGGVVELTKKQPLPVIGPHKDDQFWLDKLPQSTAQYGLPISPAFKPDRYLNEGEQLQVGAYTFDVLHIPGHTPGHVVFYCADVDLLVAGDVLFHESIGRTDCFLQRYGQRLKAFYGLFRRYGIVEGVRDGLALFAGDTANSGKVSFILFV